MAEGLDCHRGAPEEQALFFLQECFWNSDQLALAISIVILNILLRSWSLAKPVYEQIIFRSNSERWPRLSHHLSLRWSPSRSPSPLPSRSPSLLQSCHYPHLILPSIITITPITNIIIIIITMTWPWPLSRPLPLKTAAAGLLTPPTVNIFKMGDNHYNNIVMILLVCHPNGESQ